MEEITFGKLMENVLPGTELVNNSVSPEQYGIWTGKSLTLNERQYGFIFNSTVKTMVSISWDTVSHWRIRENSDGSPICIGAVPTLLAEAAGQQRSEMLLANRRAENLESQARRFKSNVQEALHNWAEQNIDLSDESKLSDFNEMMSDLDMEGLKQEYTVSITVTYSAEVTVEATSEENAREEVDNNLSDYLYDAIDVSYYEDYEIGHIEKS